MSDITVKTRFSSKLIEQALVSDDPTFYDTERRVIHLQELGVIEALQKLGWSTPGQTKGLQAENERLNQRLAEYESTPERGLKAVFGNFDLIAYSSAYIAIKREGDPNPLIIDEDGYITKRDI